MNLQVFTGIEKRDWQNIVRAALPKGSFRRILVKPNWVLHQQDPAFPIEALITSTDLLEIIVDACLENYPRAEWITVGDVPLQTCDWKKLVMQAGIGRLIHKYESCKAPIIRFLDLRREVFRNNNGFQEPAPEAVIGDPCGYREVALDSRSFLDPISAASERFRVSDYSPTETISSHRTGYHRYLIAGSALECDLFINVPKMKVHQKAGITGALKNPVGINANKAYLVHFQRGIAGRDGDEFSPDNSRLVIAQTRVRDLLQKRSRTLFKSLRPFWQMTKTLTGIQTQGTRENLSKKFYVASGAWYGNDTIWRMVFDLNRIIRYAPASGGHLATSAQRSYIAILDGVVAGEGNGPLQPLPVQAGVAIVADDPFLMDLAMAEMMGFDFQRIPCLAKHKEFPDTTWGRFEPQSVSFLFNGDHATGLQNLPVVHRFLPAPGWKDHIEKEASLVHA